MLLIFTIELTIFNGNFPNQNFEDILNFMYEHNLFRGYIAQLFTVFNYG